MDSDGSHIITGGALLFLLVLIRAYFTCCETACTEIGDGRVKSFEHEKGAKGRLYKLLEKPARLMSAFSVQRIFNAVIMALVLEWSFLEPFIEIASLNGIVTPRGVLFYAASLLLAVIVSAGLGDSLPRRLMRGERAESFAVGCTLPVSFLVAFTRPITLVAELIAAAVCALFGADTHDSGTVTEEEILMMVDAGNETGSIEQSEREMINNVFEFHEMTVSDVMTHRTDIVAVSTDAEISEVVIAAINSGFSRIPVYKRSVDHIEGIIYVKDLLCLIGTHSTEGVTVSSFFRDAEFVPESCMCDDLFKLFTEHKIQFAVAVDEYGGTAGIVTMEDLVEAIVGNIQDEYDNETEEITKISDDIYIISGTADASDTMEILGCPLPDDSEFDTMGGLVTDLLGRIPEDGETPCAEYENITFTVLITEDMRIVRIKAVINTNEKEKESEDNEEEKE